MLILTRQGPILTKIERIQRLFVVVGRVIVRSAEVIAHEISQLLAEAAIERESQSLIGGTRGLLKVVLWWQRQR